MVLSPGGGWIIICDDTYWNENFPKDAYETIDQICDDGGTLINVSFDPSGSWALMFDGVNLKQGGFQAAGNYYFGPGFSPGCVAAVISAPPPLLEIDFAPNGAPS